MKNKKLRIMVIAATCYGGMLFLGYTDTVVQLDDCQRKYGIEATLKAADDWTRKYDEQWYLKPVNLGKKWAVDSYVKNNKQKN